MTLPISAFLICQDEERYIEACIRSLDMCAEIVAVDSGSRDRTLEILEGLRREGFPLRVIPAPWLGYGAQKQLALSHCTQQWCLSIDSDERVSGKLASVLPELLARDDIDGWKLTRYDYLHGYGYVPPRAHERYYVRLFRREHGHFDPEARVHEGVLLEGKAKKVRHGGLLHFRPLPLAEQILKENAYSSLKAQMKAEHGHRAHPVKMLTSPWAYFTRYYLRHGMWRCGWAGFVMAARWGIYGFLTEAKRWEAQASAKVPPVEPPRPPGY